MTEQLDMRRTSGKSPGTSGTTPPGHCPLNHSTTSPADRRKVSPLGDITNHPSPSGKYPGGTSVSSPSALYPTTPNLAKLSLSDSASTSGSDMWRKKNSSVYGAIGDAVSSRGSVAALRRSTSSATTYTTSPSSGSFTSPRTPWIQRLPTTPATPNYPSEHVYHYPTMPQVMKQGDIAHHRRRSIVGELAVEETGRYLMIGQIPRDTMLEKLHAALVSIAEFKTMIVKHLSSKGYVFVIFDDCRQATKLVAELRRRPVKLNDAFPPVELQCVVVERATVDSEMDQRTNQIGEPLFPEAVIALEVVRQTTTQDNVVKLMGTFGEVMRIQEMKQGRKYLIEFFDARCAEEAVHKLDNAVVGAGKLIVDFAHEDPFLQFHSDSTAHTVALPFSPAYTLGSAAYRGALFGADTHHISGSSWRSGRKAEPYEAHRLHRSNPPTRYASPQSQPGERCIRTSDDLRAYATSTSPQIPLWANQVKVTPGLPHDRQPYMSSPPSHIEAFGRRAQDPAVLQGVLNSIDITARVRSGQGLGPAYDPRDRQRIPEENRVIPERIISGLDSRTTVMVKDVPNKLSRQELVNILNEVVPGEFDFVYLRFDFGNCCNVGYAFVNFTTVMALYNFVSARVGKKWNMFSSEKVLQVSYANIQGKMALINKFKQVEANSAVMTVLPDWRPQIFYSSGALKGQVEPFPISDNPMLKHRSTQARLSSLPGANSDEPATTMYDYEYANSIFDRRF